MSKIFKNNMRNNMKKTQLQQLRQQFVDDVKKIIGTNTFRSNFYVDYTYPENSRIINDHPLPRSTKTKCFDDIQHLFDRKTLEEIINDLQNLVNNPDYIKSYVDVNYDYTGYNIMVSIDEKYVPTKNDIIQYEKVLEMYEKDLKIWNQIKPIIDKYVADKKSIIDAEEIEQLKAQQLEITKKLNKLMKVNKK